MRHCFFKCHPYASKAYFERKSFACLLIVSIYMTFHESLLMSACFIFTYNRNTVKLGGAAKLR